MGAFEKITTDKAKIRFIIAAVWSVFTMVYISLVTFLDIPEKNVRFADTTLGFLLTGIVGLFMGFYFASPQGSVDKAQQLSEQGTKETANSTKELGDNGP